MSEDDGIPTLDQVVRHGTERRGNPGERRRQPQDGERSATLSDAEIEAIAKRVMERYSEALEHTIERAIRKALERKEEQKNRE